MRDDYRIDNHKLIFHPHRVARWAEGHENWTESRKIYPIYVEISPFGTCNHRCTFCAMDFLGYKANSLDIGIMRERIPEMAALGVKSVMFAGEGEPLLYRHIDELTEVAGSAGLDIAFTTNGVYLKGKFASATLAHVTWIKVSFNAGTAETYSQVHRTRPEDFYAVIDNLKAAVRHRRQNHWPVTIGVQILLLPENAHEVESLAALCRDEIGVDYLVVKPYSQHRASHTKKFASIDYSRYMKLADRLEKYNTSDFSVLFRADTLRRHSQKCKPYDRCLSTPFFWAYIMADGGVYSCSAFLQDERFRLGSLVTDSFEDIWSGEKRRQNWEMLRSRPDIDQCRVNCRMDFINSYLWELMHPNRHVNFI